MHHRMTSLGLTIVFIVLCMSYAATVPTYEAPDESAHAATTWHFATRGYDPYDAPMTYAGNGFGVFEGHQPLSIMP